MSQYSVQALKRVNGLKLLLTIVKQGFGLDMSGDPRSDSGMHQRIQVKAIKHSICHLYVQSQQKTLEQCIKYIQSEQ